MAEHGEVVFNGDGYTEEWQKDAEKRGLPNMKTTPDSLPCMVDEDIVDLLSRYNVLSKEELESRMEIYLEQYNMKVAVEAKTAVEMADTIIYPAAIKHQTLLAENCLKLRELGLPCDDESLDKITTLSRKLREASASLKGALAHEADGSIAEAKHCCEAVLPAMVTLREVADSIEELVADEFWPLPTYQEMLFIK